MSPEKKFTNRLINETSPYLLQHAHNPVDWFAWGDEALEKARREDKPILVSIGYSACHWCHVMERESFENESTAALMNKYFVNIKIDREERPDLDHIYMDAVQAMTGSGGWPLNVFLTPGAKPFYGGTYFPPVRAFNRMSWAETLQSIYTSFTEKRQETESQAENLTQYIENSNAFGTVMHATDSEVPNMSAAGLDLAAQNLLRQADKEWGGFGQAPKFPQTFSIQYLLRHYHFSKDKAALQQALLSLDKMIQGGIYDHLGGGFARYSTDTKWLAPHFEKMLYDNALLVSVLAEAYQLTGDEKYAAVIRKTLGFVERELSSAEGAFYSALDADSEGVEGKFYTWGKEETEQILGADAEIFCEVYNISKTGNWEHTNIIWLPETIAACADRFGMDVKVLQEILSGCRKKLLAFRESRIRPGLDDKILLGWNALMVTACCKAYAATGESHFLEMGEKCIYFIESYFVEHGKWKHTWKNGQAKYPAFLDDCAFLIQAYIYLQEVTGNTDYLYKAKKLTESVITEFSDEDGLFFLFTGKYQQDVIIRKKEVYDGAVPAGNSVMAQNLLYLSVIFDNTEWRRRAEKMVICLNEIIIKYPSSFGVWAMVLQTLVKGINEIAITGGSALKGLKDVNRLYIPGKILQAATQKIENFPLLVGRKYADNELNIYLCSNYACKAPVKSAEALILLLKN